MHPLIANASMVFGFALVLSLAAVVVVVGMLGLIMKVVFGALRWLTGGARQLDCGSRMSGGQATGRGCGPNWRVAGHGPGGRVCRNPRCGQDNPPMAVFCARCGHRL